MPGTQTQSLQCEPGWGKGGSTRTDFTVVEVQVLVHQFLSSPGPSCWPRYPLPPLMLGLLKYLPLNSRIGVSGKHGLDHLSLVIWTEIE